MYNRLTTASGGGTFGYDPASRLSVSSNGATSTYFGYDGADMVGEYNGSGALLRRYVHGPGSDEPLVWYEGSGTSDRRFLIADELGSIATVADASGAALANNTYTEFGAPGGSNTGRFQYTGQTWLPEAGLYNYKARVYSAALGRFLQTDPIGFEGGLNFYAYVGNDPINFVDPSGLRECYEITITRRIPVSADGIVSYVYKDITTRICRGNTLTGRDQLMPPRGLGESESLPQCPSNRGPRSPDFYEAQVLFPFGKKLGAIGGGFQIDVDRYGRVFIGPAFGISSPAGSNLTLTANWLGNGPSRKSINSFMAESAGGVSYGQPVVGPLSVVGSFQSNEAVENPAYGIGIGTPGVSLSAGTVSDTGLRVGNDNPICE